MALGPVRTVGLGIIGVFALYRDGKAIREGTVNLGGKGRDFIVTFAQDPGLFVIGILFIFALGLGCLAVVWKQWRGDE